jgi:hypothetical protein
MVKEELQDGEMATAGKELLMDGGIVQGVEIIEVIDAKAVHIRRFLQEALAIDVQQQEHVVSLRRQFIPETAILLFYGYHVTSVMRHQ